MTIIEMISALKHSGKGVLDNVDVFVGTNGIGSGFNSPRDFFKWGFLRYKNHYYRFRFNSGVVDISCIEEEFDRWANSTERTISLDEFYVEFLR